MILYLKAWGELKAKLSPDAGQPTRRVEAEGGRTLADILAGIGIHPSLVALAFKNDRIVRLDQVPSDGDVITILPPVSGG